MQQTGCLPGILSVLAVVAAMAYAVVGVIG